MAQIQCTACGSTNSEFNPNCGSCGEPLPVEGGSSESNSNPVRINLHGPNTAAGPDDISIPLPGAMISDRYEIIEVLGRGGMGTVFKARDTELARFVALKVISDQGVSEARHVRELVREAKAASALDHRNIVRVFDLSTEPGSRFIAMELIEGETLRERLDREAIGFDSALEYVIALADGLDTAHHAGIVHGDIKPGNVMISREEIKILDFGLARFRAESRTEQGGSSRDAVSGTFNYMSPEQVRGEMMDPRSDVFCLGILMCELFLGQHPFQAKDPVAVLHNICEKEARIPKHDRDLDQISRLIVRALAKKREDRFQNMRELKQALENLRREQPLLSTQPQGGGHRFLAVAAVVLIMAAVMVGSVVTLVREKPAVASVLPNADQRTILAVLPFRLIGGGDEDRALCDGLLEGVTGVLARLERDHRHFSVVSSGEVLEKKVRTASQARKQFKTNRVIDGSLQKLGSHLRIVVHVIDTETGTLMSSKTIDGRADRMLTLQDETLEAVYSMLRVEDPKDQTHPMESGNSKAYEPFLKGKGYYTRYREEKGNLDKAIHFFEEAIRLDPEFVFAHINIATAHLMKWNLEKDPQHIRHAREYVDRAMALDHEIAMVWGARGMIAEATGSYEDAVTAYKRAIALDSFSSVSRNLAETYEALERWDEAEKVYLSYYKHSGDWLSLNYLGRLYLRLGRYEDAKRVFEMAIEKRPDLAANYQVLGVVYRRLGQYDQALAQYQRGLELEPSTELYTNIGSVFFYLTRYQDAAEAFEKALDFGPTSLSHLLWANLGDVRRLLEEKTAADHAYEQAVAALDQMILMNPRRADYRIRKGLILAKLGKKQAALAEVAPHSETINVGLLLKIARTHEFLGDRAAACDYLGKAFALGLNPSGVVDDPDLAALRDDPCYANIAGGAKP